MTLPIINLIRIWLTDFHCVMTSMYATTVIYQPNIQNEIFYTQIKICEPVMQKAS